MTPVVHPRCPQHPTYHVHLARCDAHASARWVCCVCRRVLGGIYAPRVELKVPGAGFWPTGRYLLPRAAPRDFPVRFKAFRVRDAHWICAMAERPFTAKATALLSQLSPQTARRLTRHYGLKGHDVVELGPDWIAHRMEEEERGAFLVGKTDVPGGYVSTVFLGTDHARAEGPPLLFETMVFGGEADGYQKRYPTWQEAQDGHDQVVRHARGECGEPEGKTDDLAQLRALMVAAGAALP